MNSIHRCKYCQRPILAEMEIEVCSSCKNIILNYADIISSCDCSQDNVMALCRECVLNTKIITKWKEEYNALNH